MKREPDRVRRRTARSVLRRIDDSTSAHLIHCAEEGSEVASQRLQQLQREWDSDRVIETEAALTALTGLALGTLVSRRLYAIPGVVAGALLLQALTGWYPLLPLMRRLGVRSAREIARERYALKALRGDFSDLDGLPARHAGTTAAAEAGLH